ncbi:TonB-dependent siderophore receptor [Shewanella sp.]|uniref:TonB-dependent siderophore receptor n=1 Tax=Shewanella sp. TaxID=50422 RepID=UPI003A96966C
MQLQFLLSTTPPARFYKKPLSTAIGLLLAATALPTLADDTPQNNTNRDIEVVVVEGKYIVNDKLNTATGLGLTLQETPQSVSIITDQQIIDLGLGSLTDVVNSAAGVSSRAFDSSRNSFSSRGFSIDNYQIDGIPVQWDGGSSAGETQTDTALYERVEIVRGATGLLTGAGQPSASINLVRKHADSQTLSGYASVSASRWDTYRGEVDVGNALNEFGSVRGRVVAVYEDGDSYVDYAGNKKSVIYGVVDADLTDNTLLRFGASYQDNDPTASQWGGLPIFYSDGSRTEWQRSDTVGAKWTYWASEHKTYFVNLEHQFNQDWQARFNYNRTESSSDMKLLYLTGLPDKETGLGMGTSPARYDNERVQDDFGVRLTGKYALFGRQHELVLGASHSEQDFDYFTYSPLSRPAVGNFFEWDGNIQQPEWSARAPMQRMTTKQTGFYGATRLSLTDDFKVIVGARVADWERKDLLNDATFGNDGVVVPYAGALYDLSENFTLYASYTEIFQPQDAKDAEGNFLDPLTGINYEAGMKSQFLDDALHLTVTLFRTEQENFAVEDNDFTPTEDQLVAYRAAEGVTSEGFEVEVVGDITDNWKISANYTQFDATEDNSDGESNTVNTRFPSKLFRLFTVYNWQQLSVGGGVNWEGKSYTDVTNGATGNSERVGQGAYALVNLMARYDITPQLSAQLNIDNLFDKTYYSQIGFYTQLAYAEPRNATLTLRYKF